MLDRFRSIFVVEFDNGRARLGRGRPPHGFVSACDDIARLYRIATGQVECLGQGRYARLRFSKEVPERARQPIRNVWTPPPTPGAGKGRKARR